MPLVSPFPGIQQPPVVECKRSYAEEFNNRNAASDDITARIRASKESIKKLNVSYDIDYKSFMNVAYDASGDQKSISVTEEPVSGISYEVTRWIMADGRRRKTYKSESFSSSRSLSDSGTVIYDGDKLKVLSGRFKDICKSFDDPKNERQKNDNQQTNIQPVEAHPGLLFFRSLTIS